MHDADPGTRRRVLLVDDDPGLLELVTTVLDLRDLDVVPVVDGQVALDMVGDRHFDVVVCDVRMPPPDGLEVCRRIKADPDTGDLPVILLTGRTTAADREQGVAAGCDAYLTKPFSPLQLLDLIQSQPLRDRVGGG